MIRLIIKCLAIELKSLKVGDATDEEDQRLIQGIIPDMILDARGRMERSLIILRTTEWAFSSTKPLRALKSLLSRVPKLFKVISKSEQKILLRF